MARPTRLLETPSQGNDSRRVPALATHSQSTTMQRQVPSPVRQRSLPARFLLPRSQTVRRMRWIAALHSRRDRERSNLTQWLKLQGIEVIRFTSQDIEQDTQRVPRDIDNCFETVTQTGITSSSPNPFSSDDRGEGELKPRAHLIVLFPPFSSRGARGGEGENTDLEAPPNEKRHREAFS